MPEIRRIDIPQLVRVRKYEVDCERLRNLLREHKKLTGKSNKALAEALSVPITKVEHWFRTDSCFAIPDAEIWERLKTELGITTIEFDESITTFEERPGVYEKSERCYFADGIAPTLTSTSAGNEKIIVEGYKVEKAVADAMRGRYNETGKVEQQVEVSDREYANTITSVQKDSMAAINTIIDDTQGFDGARFYGDYSPSLRASRHGLKTVDPNFRIRKLTPKECFRLMGFDDSDHEKAAAVNSNTQLYKQVGNSIVVPVVQGILEQLFTCGALSR